jgi:hypothetical protein
MTEFCPEEMDELHPELTLEVQTPEGGMNEWGELIPGSSSGSPSCRLRLEREGSLSLEQEVLVAVLLRLLSSVIVAIISPPSFAQIPSLRLPSTIAPSSHHPHLGVAAAAAAEEPHQLPDRQLCDPHFTGRSARLLASRSFVRSFES